MKQKRNDGFTLVELLLSILTASLVLIAASSMLLFGSRLGAFGYGDAQRQNAVQVIHRYLLQNTDKITKVHYKTDGEITVDPPVNAAPSLYTGEEGEGTQVLSWSLVDNAENILFSYENEALYIGNSENAAPVIENVVSTTLTVQTGEKPILTITFTVKTGQSYQMAFACG